MLLPFLRSSQHYMLEKAIEFVSMQLDDDLWEELIRQCLSKPEMIGHERKVVVCLMQKCTDRGSELQIRSAIDLDHLKNYIYIEADKEAQMKEGKIMDEKNKSMSSSGGDDTPINEVEILERSLGQRRGHIRGVGRTVKSVTPDFAQSMSYTPHNQDLHNELRQANARWQEQQEINLRMQQQINELMSRQKAFDNPFENTYKPTFEEEEEEEDDDDSE
ncbi:hypothetical protein E3N88_00317 [Mikania micrantha]|uniref:NGN domain-containing protein n=1 Tax=Mikania micrantha TaxID=192012 RepID=A0A5N6PZQ1_9ASTR|nr:hypothetical protein E3N88_00317 [Mikania micrantha]